ncbi:MAG: type II secretion system protein G [Acidobacteria bacterium]|nr:type II secretion system protein G [Acidobacteriota bacterium]MBV9478224.1 type II secretion system protein G [Acidobacteriota bacterium]
MKLQESRGRHRFAAGIALLLAIACREHVDRRPETLRAMLAQMRAAIARFHHDTGRYPHALDELVPKYLPRVPVDPITNSAKTWRFDTEETVAPSADFTTAAAKSDTAITDVHSGAGKPYSDF